MEKVKIICPACGQQVDAVVNDGRVKGYCSVAIKYVDFLSETQCANGNKAKISKVNTSTKKDRDSKGRFAKGNVPWNKSR